MIRLIHFRINFNLSSFEYSRSVPDFLEVGHFCCNRVAQVWETGPLLVQQQETKPARAMSQSRQADRSKHTQELTRDN